MSGSGRICFGSSILSLCICGHLLIFFHPCFSDSFREFGMMNATIQNHPLHQIEVQPKKVNIGKIRVDLYLEVHEWADS